MNYAKLNNKILAILKPVKNRPQIAAAIMLLKQSENKAIDQESTRTDKVVDEKVNSLKLYMGPHYGINTSGSLKTSLLNLQAGSKRIEPEDMEPGTIYQGEMIAVMSHGEGESYSLFLSVGTEEVQISLAGTDDGMSDQYRLRFQIHFSHGENVARKLYFTGFFEDKDQDGHIIQRPITAVQRELNATTYKDFDIKYQGTSVTTACQVVSLTLHKYPAPTDES